MCYYFSGLFYCYMCTVCLTFHELSSCFPAFTASRLLRPCADWTYGWITFRPLALRSRVFLRFVPTIVSPPPHFEGGGNVRSHRDSFWQPGVSVLQDERVHSYEFFVISCILWRRASQYKFRCGTQPPVFFISSKRSVPSQMYYGGP